MRKLFIPLLAVIALPTVINAGNEKDLIVVTDLGEKIIIKESDIQVERDTKNKLITMINDRTEGHINSTKDCIANNNENGRNMYGGGGPNMPPPCQAGLQNIMGICRSPCEKKPNFNGIFGYYTDYKGKRCGSISCITIWNGDKYEGVWSCSGRPE